MQAEIETLEHTEGGWLLRFWSRSQATFTATKEQLKRLIEYPDRDWDPDALAGRGAWFIEQDALAKVGHLFSNYTFCRWRAEEGNRLRAEQQRAERARRRREAEARRGQEAASQAAAIVPTNYHQAFTLLQLPESSSVKQIQEVYRQLVLKHHPDLGGQHLMMVAINAAYRLALAYAKATPAA